METSDNPKYEEHVHLWTNMLRAFLHWSDLQIAQWALRFKSDIESENSGFYHETPEWYVAHCLLPMNLVRTVPGVEFSGLIRDLERVLGRVLESLDEDDWEAFDRVDWSPAIKEVNDLLGKYGYSLDDVAMEKVGWYRQDDLANS